MFRFPPTSAAPTPRRRGAAAWSCLGALLLAAPTAKAAAPFDAGAEAALPLREASSLAHLTEIMNLIASSDTTEEGRGRALAYVVSKGPRAVPAITALLSRTTAIPDELEVDGPFLTPKREAMLFEALHTWDAVRVAEELQGQLEAQPSLALRTLAIRILGRVGNARCLESFLELVDGLQDDQLGHPSLRKPCVTSMAEILARDPLSFVVLNVLIGELDGRMSAFTIEALGAAGRADGVDLLERMLGRSPAEDELVLTAFSKLRPRDLARVAPQVRAIVRPYLHSAEHGARRAAARTLGNLGDSESFAELVELLQDTDRRVSESALGALRQMAGTRWPAAPERWMRWYKREASWAAGRAQELAREIESGSPETAAKAIRELGQHPLFGERIIRVLRDGASHGDRNVAVLACETLGRLRTPEALDPLVEALFDPRVAVREAAADGLRRATGESMPADGAVWREWLEG